jgi:hypothetical protein
MKKLITLMFAISPIIMSCNASNPTMSAGIAEYPSASPSTAPMTSDNSLNNLKLGVLPGTNLSDDEKRLADVMARKITPIFPLRLGVLLYKSISSIDEKLRKENYNKFIEKLKLNSDVSLIQEIPSSLLGNTTDIEDLRRLAARFQVSNLLIINDAYQIARESKTSILTPIDIVSGMRNWESTSNIEVFSLDVLNGVFVSTINSNITNTEKYNKNSINENKENALTIKTVNNAWEDVTSKVEKKIAEFKQQAGN